MGSKQSRIIATPSTSSSSQSSSMPQQRICCLSPRSKLFQFLDKLRRAIKRHLTLRRRKRVQRGYGARAALLRPMPRCSSFGSCGTLLTPTAKRQDKKKPTAADTHYAQWKCMFEHAGKPPTPPAQRPHDISEALTGQTTPQGFPSHTDARRCLLPAKQSISYDRRLNDAIQIRRRLSFRLPGSNQNSIRRLTARQRAVQARLDAKMQQDLCDLEEYYGFHYTRRNERRI